MDHLAELEPRSRTLDPGPEERARVRGEVMARAEAFLAALPDAPAYVPGDLGVAELRDVPEAPLSASDVLDRLMRGLTPGVNPASGRLLAYIPGGGLHASALGDFLAAVTNRYAGVRFAGPGAAEIEDALVAWMARVVGFPAGCGGTLTSGGSLATLVAVVSAREAMGVRARDVERSCVYLAPSAHLAVPKALRVAGLGECPLRSIPLDARQRLDVAALREAIAADRAAGLRPFLVVASAGTTDTGAIDPLPAMADAAREAGAWLHVDGAYGGFFALVPSLRERLSGMERADSLVLDPHKGLFLPYGTGAVLVRDREAMRRAHAATADYLAGTGAGEGANAADLSPELTRHFRGLRLWLPLQLHGVAAFRACLEEKALLARRFAERVRAMGFEVIDPDLSVVAFRHPGGDAVNDRLLAALQQEGRVFLSGTKVGGRSTLRLAALVFRTHLAEVDEAAERVEAQLRRIVGAG